MRRHILVLGLVWLGVLLLEMGTAYGQQPGSIVSWGSNNDGQCNVPSPNAHFVAVAADLWHSLGLKSDGTIVAWGSNNYGQCDVPSPNADFVDVAAGVDYSLGLKSDGMIVAWGWNHWGQCDVPSPNVDFVAVAAGGSHNLGLKSDGTIVAWGYNDYGLGVVPSPNADFVAVEAGGAHNLGLKSDGTIVAWGLNDDGQCNVPSPYADFVAVSAGGYYNLGLKSDGTIVAWGDNFSGQCDVPSPNADFVAVASGGCHSLGLKSDGTIVAWGWNLYGQCNVPSYNADFVAIAAGSDHSLGLTDIATIDYCGTLTKPNLCIVLEVESGNYYWLENHGGFNIGDYVRVIGTVEYGTSPCYVTDVGIINNTISLCNTTWYIKPDGSGDRPTIQAGIDAAMNGHTVILAGGIFSGSGNRDIDYRGKAVTVTSQHGADSTIIDCEGLGRGFLFQSGEDSTSVLSGVTIQNAAGTYVKKGGGIFCRDSSPTIRGNILQNNTSYWGGGGILNWMGAPDISGNLFINNQSDVDGGAVCSDGGTPVIRENTIIDNYADGFGGGICCCNGGIITGNTLSINIASVCGGGIYADRCTVSNNIVVSNTSSEGGGIYAERSTVIGNTIADNNASSFGGGIRVDRGATIDNTLSGNTAWQGAGIYSWPECGEIMGNTIRANIGDGIYLMEYYSGNVRENLISANTGSGIYCNFTSVTITGNTLSENSGAGIYCYGDDPGPWDDPLIENNIIAFNSGAGVFCSYSGATPTIVCTDIYGNLSGDSLCGIDGGGNFSADPRFCGPLGSGDYFLQSISPCTPANSPCGTLIGALPVGCGIISKLLQCPSDSIVTAFSNIPSLVLEGFAITNIDTFDLAFSYYLAAEGPALLVDNGNSTSLSGTTPVLSPGESISPPEAALDIPSIGEYWQEFVTYYVSAVGHPGILDSCTTVITFDPLVTILITGFEGRVIDSGVELVWDVASDKEIKGFKIYRVAQGEEVHKLINSNGLIPKKERKYIDKSVLNGQIYQYTLSVVLGDNSEVQSPTVTVKTKAYKLALQQNYPNPFNPVTTIRFFLPETQQVTLIVYDVSGRAVATLVDRIMSFGDHTVEWDTRNQGGHAVSSGVYYYQLVTNKCKITRKMVLIR